MLLRRRALLPLLAQLLLATGAAGNGSAGIRGGDRPNVLLICVDDLRPDLGCYGSASASTPHMDALAGSALLFEQHFVQAPSCGPSRAALLTGRSPARSGRLANDCLYRGPLALRRAETSPEDGVQTLPEAFRTSGYRTVCIGKISHTPDGRVFAYDGSGDGRHELPRAWDDLATPVGPWQRGWGAFFAYAGGAHREDGQGHRALLQFDVERDDELPDGLLAAAASRQLAELAQRDQPFFLGVGFYKPHLPLVAPAADRAHFDGVELPLPAPSATIGSRYTSKSGEFYGYNAPFEKTRPLSPAATLEVRRAYYACVRYVDRQVGAVLGALETSGLAESTIVVLWSDHGWHLGESGVWGKHTLFDRSLHSPLMIRVPGSATAGTRTDAIVESLDVFPTLVELCGLGELETAFPLDGDSLAPLLRGEAARGAGDAAAFWQRGATIRTSKHRLLATRGPAPAAAWEHVELYRTSDGPGPQANVAAEEPETATRLLARLERVAR